MQNCDLNTLQVWAGYLSWLGLFKVLGATILAVGIIVLLWGVIKAVVYQLRQLLEVGAYLGSFALIGSGYWVGPEYLTWTVMVGCLLFAASVFGTIMIHNIKGEDPKPLAALFMTVWGAVGIYYNMQEVGFLSVIAFMSLIGFTTVIRSMNYMIGFENEEVIPTATMTAFLLVLGYTLTRIFASSVPDFVQVFMPGAFWMGSLVAMTGLLIMTSRYYHSGPYSGSGWAVSQVLFILVAMVGLFVGMTYGINAMAGICGVYLVLYLAEKPLEITPHNAVGVGLMLIASGGIMFGAWKLAMAHESVVMKYLTASI